MARTPHPARDQAITQYRNLESFHGSAEAERIVRQKFADVPKTTVNGWLKLARLPAEPSSLPVTAARASGSTGGDAAPVDFEERIARIDRHVAMIVAQCTAEVVDPATGARTVKAKSPVVLGQAVRLQVQAAELLVKYHATVWDQERMEGFQRVVIEEVGKIDPATQRAIVARLREMGKHDNNPGARFGIGISQAIAAAE